LQVDLGCSVKVSAQEAPMQSVPAAPCVQAPFVHVPVLPQGGLLLGHIPCNSVAPLPRFAHEPDAQVWQVPQTDELQHLPSTQKLVVHSWPSEQPALGPGDFFSRHIPLVPPEQ